jgi:hypothetical protein
MTQTESSMGKRSTGIVQLALAGLLVSGLAAAAQAETGAVRVVFTKGGFIWVSAAAKVCSRSAAVTIHSGFRE